MDWLDNIKMGKKLIGSFLIMAILLGIVAAIGYVEMKNINDGMTSMYFDRAVPLDQLGDVDADLGTIAQDILAYTYVPDERKEASQSIEEMVAEINKQMDLYRKTALVDAEKTELEKFDTSWAVYQKEIKDIFSLIDAGKDKEALDRLHSTFFEETDVALDASVNAIKDINVQEAEHLNTQGDETFASATLILAVIGIIGVIFALALGYILSRSITAPLTQGVTMMQEMSLGHLGTRLNLLRKDEIGSLAQSMDSFSDDLQNTIIAGMKKIGVGDLSVSISPKDERDEISPAMVNMLTALNGLVSEAKMLSQAAIDGKLATRGDATRFQGGYQEVITGLNDTLEGVVVPVNEAMRLAGSYSKGDYTDRISTQISMKGDFIAFKDALNQIGIQGGSAIGGVKVEVESLSAGMEETSASAEEVASTTSMLAQSSNEVSIIAERSGSGIRQTLTAMEDLSHTVSSVAGKAEQASVMAKQTVELSEKGVLLAGKAEKGMEGIMVSAQETNVIIDDISNQMEEIGKIVDVITGIAEQTGLLALNAAIEAARAGDAGMGFAVVADEVKSLALESQKSAENIASIIGNLQKKSLKASESMKNAAKDVKTGNEAVSETLEVFNEIVQAINVVHANMTEVAGATEEQAAAVEEITASVNEVGNLVQQTAKEAVDSAAATEEVTASIDQITRAITDAAASVQRIAGEMGKFTTN